MLTPQTKLPSAATKAAQRRSRKPFKWQDLLSYTLLTIAAILVLMPLLWMFSTSLRPLGDSFKLPPQWLPTQWRFENYLRPFESNVPFELFFWNSLKIASLTTLGQLISCSMAGYAFARLRFPGRDFLFIVLLASLMVPGQVTNHPDLPADGRPAAGEYPCFIDFAGIDQCLRCVLDAAVLQADAARTV